MFTAESCCAVPAVTTGTTWSTGAQEWQRKQEVGAAHKGGCRYEHDEQKNEGPFLCSKCGGDAFIGYSNWRDKEGRVMIKKRERLCMRCARQRGVEFSLNKKTR